MADPIPEPLDLDEVFAPYKPDANKRKVKESTTISGAIKNTFQEGRGGYLLGAAGVGAASYGVKKAWDKSVASNLELVKTARQQEIEALGLLKGNPSYANARATTLNRPLVGSMSGATASGAELPAATAEQLALAKDITRSKWLRPFGVGQYADSALTPKITVNPKYYVEAGAGQVSPVAQNPLTAPTPLTVAVQGRESSLGLTGLTERVSPRPFTVSASSVPEIIAGKAPLTNMAREGLPLNNYQRFGNAINSMQFGNARLPLNSAGNVGKSLFGSGLGWGAMVEGGLAAYDTWPEFLGGSGNNVYGQTVDELRAGVNKEDNQFAYNYVAPIGGALATGKRWGEVPAQAATLGLYGLTKDALDMDKALKKKEKEMENAFEAEPEKFRPDVLEKTRQRALASGLADPNNMGSATRADTPEAWDEYNRKVAELKKKKKSEKK